jgi:2-haloacid dehalogenase
MAYALGFDVYGTLVDPLGLDHHLQPLAGEKASDFAKLWRQKQLEYSFRKGLMEKYENFEICTIQALKFTVQSFGIQLSEKEQNQLIDNYQDLPKFEDVQTGLERLGSQGHRMAAFSNGVESQLRELLQNAGLIQLFEGIISVDEIKMFKPHPSVYRYLQQRLERPLLETWLVSSNPWDAIGAKAAGIRAAWVKRAKDTVFDPWGIDPDVVVSGLEELADYFQK